MEKTAATSLTSTETLVIRRGIRSSRCLSLPSGWSPREKWITINDFLEIASEGYDQVRLPVDKNVLWTASGERDEETFAAIGRIVSHARTAGIKVTVDVCEKPSPADESVWRTKTDLKSFFGKGETLKTRTQNRPYSFNFGTLVRNLLAVA